MLHECNSPSNARNTRITSRSLRVITPLIFIFNTCRLRSHSPHATNTSSPLPKSLSALYTQMSKTTDSVLPLAFLQTLRQVVPQFGEMDRSGKGGMGGYAQQDAEECWGAILGNLKDVPVESGSESSSSKFVESYMMGTMRRE